MNDRVANLEEVIPNAADFIQSIAEQGYRLETALADLVDNAISAEANKIEVLIDTSETPFSVFIADNGRGMSASKLSQAMSFPSQSLANAREQKDLGRFGLGLKTASFSQTQEFSILSRPNSEGSFNGKTWDLKLLREEGWKIRNEDTNSINSIFNDYQICSDEKFIGRFDERFSPSTIVVWKGLFKYEKFITERDKAETLKSDITNVINPHLSLIFHRFMERAENPISIRVNNIRLQPFNPFPSNLDGVRQTQKKRRLIEGGTIKIDGIILPSKSIEDTSRGATAWCPKGKSLLDMEGIYLYRANRLILSGTWLHLVKRSQRMQLARMRVEVENDIDHLLNLNIAKSQVDMPKDLRRGLEDYAGHLKESAEKEYLNRTIRRFPVSTPQLQLPLIVTSPTNRGAELRLNHEFPILSELLDNLAPEHKTQVMVICKILLRELNNIRKVHEPENFLSGDNQRDLGEHEFEEIVNELLNKGFSAEYIRKNLISAMGLELSSLPPNVLNKLTGE